MPVPPAIHQDPPPLRLDGDALRVGASRVTLDVLVREYQDGADPEAIADAYPAMPAADVYGAIAYYLRHKEELDAYLARRREEAATLRREIEARQGPSSALRERLEARRAGQEGGHAAPRG